MTPLLPALLLAGAASMSVQPLEGGWFRLTILYKGSSVEAHANAQIRLITAASRLCKGKGRPVSGGSLRLDEVPKPDGAARRRGRVLALSEEWRCAPTNPSP